MKHILDIIIPEYNVNLLLLKRALNSINYQKNIDFESIGIIVISDASKNRLKRNWFKQNFPKLSIEYYYNDINVGPGLARQYGIDKSTAEYITFLDQDDEFNNNLGYIIKALMDNGSVDILWTNFSEEILYNKKIMTNTYNPSDYPTVHGLFVKRQFLIDNDIRFLDELKFNEDEYFSEVLMLCFNSNYLDVTSYLWKYNKDSTVRKNKENWNVTIIEYFIKNMMLVYKKLEKYNKDIRHKKIISSMYAAYLIINSPDFSDKNRKEKCINDLIDIYNDVKQKSFNLISENERKDIYINQYEVTRRTLDNVPFLENFEEWLNDMMRDRQ